ncbi:C2H2-type zinc finger protein [Candidatus Cardinium hertigii]|uniref:C2H2-type zinc finger protein n=1 Tax=Candidatus Cardinium hertigii TaxID=247481 RepID=UPI003D7E7920
MDNSELQLEDKKIFTCKCCGEVMGYRELKDHEMIHKNKPYRCDTCGKGFYRLDTLKVHHRSYTGEKPYICYRRDKSFTTSSNLTKH